ncbi:glycosyltransferase family 4 protein [Saccharopolyspora griseoalba]|uniref:Glycosyltransferase family 4 protein n=1 Tax=Saccharopolyspora griseoalba TaxID=1431848 RepID=A0ABW2LG35_9PSEU
MAAEPRVLLDGTPLLGARTGIGRYTASLAAALAQHLDLRLIGFSARGARRLRALAPPGSRAVGPPVPARLLRKAWSRGPFPPVELLGGAARVVHGTNFVLPPSRRAAGVVTVHDLAFLDDPRLAEPDLAALVADSVRRASVVCTPSAAVAAAVSARLAVEPAKIAVTPLGVDPEWFDAAPPSAEDRAAREIPSEYLLFVGATGPRKGLPKLLEALHPGLPPLVVAGPGQPGPDGRALRTGYVPEAELRRLVAGASALVLPSRDEGFGLPVLEALACGVPVVCSDLPALREVAGEQAAFADPDDPVELRAALHRALQDPPDADLSRARAAEFTWEACAGRTLEAYRRATGG